MKVLITALFALLCFTTCHAQSLKITDVKSSYDKMYRDASQLLGKNLNINIYDSSVSVEMPSEKPMYLKLVSDNYYSATIDENDVELWTAKLTVYKTIG